MQHASSANQMHARADSQHLQATSVSTVYRTIVTMKYKISAAVLQTAGQCFVAWSAHLLQPDFLDRISSSNHHLQCHTSSNTANCVVLMQGYFQPESLHRPPSDVTSGQNLSTGVAHYGWSMCCGGLEHLPSWTPMSASCRRVCVCFGVVSLRKESPKTTKKLLHLYWPWIVQCTPFFFFATIEEILFHVAFWKVGKFVPVE